MSESPLRVRPRRLRQNPIMRGLAAEVDFADGFTSSSAVARRLMLPHFVVPGTQVREPVNAMPGVDRLSVDLLVAQVGEDLRLGLDKILLFGVPHQTKDAGGSSAWARDGVVQQAIRALKQAFGQDLLIATDVCLCAYTDHGHCGVLGHAKCGEPGFAEGDVDNDATLPNLTAMGLSHAEAGADMVAPSDMMDGRIGSLREGLDKAGYVSTAILSYAVKYASAYYGPFREAAGSKPGKGSRKSYQMDPRNRREAVREALLDEAEGADMLMVKPALAYLDVLAALRDKTNLPLACYNVSGEYSMVKAAASLGYIDERAVVTENLQAMRRAGADLIITYHARDVLQHGWIG